MALDKNKLQDVSFGGFDVENMETLERQLRETLKALHAKNYSAALASAHAMQARTVSLVHQCERRLERYHAKGVA